MLAMQLVGWGHQGGGVGEVLQGGVGRRGIVTSWWRFKGVWGWGSGVWGFGHEPTSHACHSHVEEGMARSCALRDIVPQRVGV